MKKTSEHRLFWRAIVPVVIGLGVTAWLLWDDIAAGDYSRLQWSGRMTVGVLLALLFAFGRDFGLAWRFRTIARPLLDWKHAFRVDLMCAFTSAITPSAVGGSAFAIFYLNREGLDVGHATTMTLTTLFLDEMFFVVFCPIIMLLIPTETLFGNAAGVTDSFGYGVQVVFWLVYAGIVIWAAILFMGIIAKPRPVSMMLKKLAMLRILRRWRRNIFSTADNMMTASHQLRHRGTSWWLNVFGATTVSWFSRYLVVNALFWGFVPEASALLVFGRQFVVWVLLMVSPTPGGSGVSEWLFTSYYGDIIPSTGIVLLIAIAWRIITFYTYLTAGSILLPSYFKTKQK